MDIEVELRERTRLEDRIKELGGTIPDRWPHDTDGQYRNLQLQELVEDLLRARTERFTPKSREC